MRRILAFSLVVLLAFGNFAFGQQVAKPEPATDSTPAAPTSTVAPATSASSAVAPTVPAVPNTLMDGTQVKVRLAETISSADATVGQQVPFEVTEDVVVQGVTVIAKGASALGTVTEAQPKRRMGRGGKLNVNIDSVRLVDGEKAQLRAVKNSNGGGHVGAMTGAMVATAIVFFPAAPLFLFMKGKDITIPKGTAITAFIQGDMKLDMVKFAPAGAAGNAVAAVVPVAQTASLAVDASVPNCDIEIDGNFVGNTPSTLTVTPGKHVVVVKKTGYSDWTRTMMVDAGTVRLNAEMVAVK